MIIAALSDHREAARRRLPHFLFEYIDGGAGDESTLHANRADLHRVALDQRVMVDVSRIDTATTLFDQPLPQPVILGPVGLAGLCARRGEVQAASAARDAGLPFTLSTVGLCSISEVAEGAGAPPWFQLYMLKDRGVVAALIERARAAHCPALVFTVDLPTPGPRHRDRRSGLTGSPGPLGQARRALQAAIRPRWVMDVAIDGTPLSLGNLGDVMGANAPLLDFLGWIGQNFDPAASWADLAHIRKSWSGPLIVKGILHPDDARAALDCGADALVVSNHGGRQLDGAVSAVRALPAIADAVAGRVPILADGGVRSGADVLRYLQLGAHAVMLGRLWAWALASGGEAGVRTMLAQLQSELATAMALTGRTRLPGA